jgi:hypothetical protein
MTVFTIGSVAHRVVFRMPSEDSREAQCFIQKQVGVDSDERGEYPVWATLCEGKSQLREGDTLHRPFARELTLIRALKETNREFRGACLKAFYDKHHRGALPLWAQRLLRRERALWEA